MASLQELIARNLRRVRLDRGLTQRELAFRAGLDGRCIPLLERGSYSATVTMLDRLACALGVAPSILLGVDEPAPAAPAPPLPAGAPRPLDASLGRRLRSLRKARGLSRAALAANLGLSRRGLQNYERGVKRMRPILLERAAAILEVRISTFFADQRFEAAAPATRRRVCRHEAAPPPKGE
jgi:transcriptional regulator with XRE-family HTH domain